MRTILFIQFILIIFVYTFIEIIIIFVIVLIWRTNCLLRDFLSFSLKYINWEIFLYIVRSPTSNIDKQINNINNIYLYIAWKSVSNFILLTSNYACNLFYFIFKQKIIILIFWNVKYFIKKYIEKRIKIHFN